MVIRTTCVLMLPIIKFELIVVSWPGVSAWFSTVCECLTVRAISGQSARIADVRHHSPLFVYNSHLFGNFAFANTAYYLATSRSQIWPILFRAKSFANKHLLFGDFAFANTALKKHLKTNPKNTSNYIIYYILISHIKLCSMSYMFLTKERKGPGGDGYHPAPHDGNHIWQQPRSHTNHPTIAIESKRWSRILNYLL